MNNETTELEEMNENIREQTASEDDTAEEETSDINSKFFKQIIL